MSVYMPKFVNLQPLSPRAGDEASSVKHSQSAQSRAFTLIELLVVIAIIAILASLVVPALSRAKGQSYKTLCANNFRQIAMATRLYCDDNSDYFPYQNSGFVTNAGPGWLFDVSTNLSNMSSPSGMMTGQLWPFLKSANVYFCPLDKPTGGNASYRTYNYAEEGEFTISARPQQCSSYCMTAIINGSAGGYITQKWTDFRSDGICYWETDENGGYGVWNSGSNIPDNWETHRHSNGGNVVSFDTHIEWMSWTNFNYQATLFPGRLWCNPQLPNGSKWPNFP